MLLQKHFCRSDQALYLAWRDGFHAIAEIGIAAVTHLHKYQLLVMGHDEIQLAETAAVVSVDKFQALLKQMLTGFSLCLLAASQVLRCVSQSECCLRSGLDVHDHGDCRDFTVTELGPHQTTINDIVCHA